MDDGSAPRRNVMLRAADALFFCYFSFGRNKRKVDAEHKRYRTAEAKKRRPPYLNHAAQTPSTLTIHAPTA